MAGAGKLRVDEDGFLIPALPSRRAAPSPTPGLGSLKAEPAVVRRSARAAAPAAAAVPPAAAPPTSAEGPSRRKRPAAAAAATPSEPQQELGTLQQRLAKRIAQHDQERVLPDETAAEAERLALERQRQEARMRRRDEELLQRKLQKDAEKRQRKEAERQQKRQRKEAAEHGDWRFVYELYSDAELGRVAAGGSAPQWDEAAQLSFGEELRAACLQGGEEAFARILRAARDMYRHYREVVRAVTDARPQDAEGAALLLRLRQELRCAGGVYARELARASPAQQPAPERALPPMPSGRARAPAAAAPPAAPPPPPHLAGWAAGQDPEVAERPGAALPLAAAPCPPRLRPPPTPGGPSRGPAAVGAPPGTDSTEWI
eukprot:TRINITY_DN29090_c0_g1_i1.p1 TRINITY_DN29090_c0_g1~~TRINITY_DN29090_c0_g1_i1.p1  ORF type:complete len:374 (+),score=105.04 TRINITY_DN29090_c0_g1_i1:64-1185(+)